MDDNMEEFDSSVFFPSLISLDFWKMGKLKGWWKSREFSPKDPGQSFLLSSFHCLSTLKISSCPQMFSSPFPNSSSLKTLHLGNFEAEYFRREIIGSASPEDDTLSSCYNLVMLRDWIGNLTSLKELNISYRPGLTLLFESICQLSSLKNLTISGYEDLVMLLDWIGNLTSLLELTISFCSRLTLLPEGIRQLSSLRNLTIRSCNDLAMLPEWIGNLTSLQELEIRDCPKLTLLPEGIRQLSSLRSLTINGCEDLVMLPDWIGNLTTLEELEIRDCPKLSLLPEGIRHLCSMRFLTICGCKRLEERCKPQIGEDWSKIAHVEHVRIGW